MSKLNIQFNGKPYEIEKGLTILEASFETQKMPQEFKRVELPTLYYLKGINDTDESGVCVVEVDGKLVNASKTKIQEGMNIIVNSDMVVTEQKKVLAEILKHHNKDCLHCSRSTSCELQNLLHQFGFRDEQELPEADKEELDLSSMVLVRDPNKCIACKRCINVCAKKQAVSAIVATGQGLECKIQPSSPKGLAAASCVNCGQCVAVCPVGALSVKSNTDQVKEALQDKEKYVIAQVAPAVRVALGEEFEFPIGIDVEGRIVAALRKIGFDKVFDTTFGADLTVIEEANELLERIENGGEIPMFTSCCPGWIKYAEHFYPDLLDNISSCKSPHQMTGAVAKTYVAEQIGVNPENIVMVSIMPCTAKKFEITRDDECGAGLPDVDIVITTRELASLIKDYKVQMEAMPFEKFDTPLGEGSGAGVIFGNASGVMEAVIRHVTDSEEPVVFTKVPGMTGVKEATCKIKDKSVKVATVSGLANTNMLLTCIKEGDVDYQFVEVMACPNGCLNGGGQPVQSAATHMLVDVCKERANALFENDAKRNIHKSGDNEEVKKLYDNFLDVPGSEKSHSLLHTTYIVR